MKKPLIAANWKMNGTQSVNHALLSDLLNGLHNAPHLDVAIFPPSLYIAQVAQILNTTPVCWGAQNLSEHAQGAYTGEICAAMLNDLKCHYVLVGHSERRQYYGETNETIAAKCVAAVKANLKPIVCVGETLAEREADHTDAVILNQLDAVVSALGRKALSQLTIAYEPIWAIGTGHSATGEQAQAVHSMIRAHLAEQDPHIAKTLRILYGGSVKPTNAAALSAMADIDGALVGGASLNSDSFLGIIRSWHS